MYQRNNVYFRKKKKTIIVQLLLADSYLNEKKLYVQHGVVCGFFSSSLFIYI